VPKRFLAEGVSVKGIVGKQGNPFLWKNGKDFMIWDQDITPEGVGFQVAGAPTEMLSLYGTPVLHADENGAKDPHAGVQGGRAHSDRFDFTRATPLRLALGERRSDARRDRSLITDTSDYRWSSSSWAITKFERGHPLRQDANLD
jgi:hypothetical protein